MFVDPYPKLVIGIMLSAGEDWTFSVGITTLKNLFSRRNKSISNVTQKTDYYFFKTFKIVKLFMLRIKILY